MILYFPGASFPTRLTVEIDVGVGLVSTFPGPPCTHFCYTFIFFWNKGQRIFVCGWRASLYSVIGPLSLIVFSSISLFCVDGVCVCGGKGIGEGERLLRFSYNSAVSRIRGEKIEIEINIQPSSMSMQNGGDKIKGRIESTAPYIPLAQIL